MGAASKTVIAVILFSYIFIIRIFSVTTVPLIVLISPIVFILVFFSKKNRVYISNNFNFSWVVILFSCLLFFSILSSLLNQNLDVQFIFYIINQTMYISIGILLFVILFPRKTEKEILEIIILVFLLQNIITTVHYFYPLSLVTETIRINFYDKVDLWGGQVRLYGVGLSNAQGGSIYGAFYLLITYYISRYPPKNIALVVTYCVFMYSVMIGVGVARTAVIGLALSLVYLLVVKRVALVKIFFALVIFASLAYYFLSEILNENVLFTRMLEPILSFLESGSFATRSSSATFDMYLFPDNLKTLFIGDGLWKDPQDTQLYYMHIDPGVFRMVFYFGVVGVFFFFLYLISIIYSSKRFNKQVDRNYSYLKLFTFTYLVLLQFKGIGIVPSLLSLIIFLGTFSLKKSKKI